ncbi:GNAT family N-acetyltransferase [Paenibacillus harenae]|uniref:GNAT family N-acetyltransferase n=1 Tax=Paenibacillus harenae TaxID=306543 RepID=UPI000413A268|nr:GNAT family N-acetyltransferase [Paenibacillus harenae]
MNFIDTIIRSAEAEDYPSVAKLVAQLHEMHVMARPDIYSPDPCPLGREYYQKLLQDEKAKVIVAAAADTGAVMAYTVIRINSAPYRQIFKPRNYIHIDDFCVDRSYRGQGIGKKLMEYVMDNAREISAECIELGVSEFNVEAIAFYESLGMKIRSRRMELFVE